MAFWRRKSKDTYITLGLNEPAAPPAETQPAETGAPPAAATDTQAAPTPPAIEPTVTGG